MIKKWYKFLSEQKKFPRLINHQCDISFKSGKLKDLIEADRKIKSLKVPGWSLQEIYKNETSEDRSHLHTHIKEPTYAAVAYCNDKPIAITVLIDDTIYNEEDYFKPLGKRTGMIHFFVDSWHRGMGLADKLFNDVVKFSQKYQLIIAARGGKHMPEKHGFIKAPSEEQECDYIDCEVYVNKFYGGSKRN